MRIGTNIKDTDANKTTEVKSKPAAEPKQDLNMTAPITEHIKNDRKAMNDFVN